MRNPRPDSRALPQSFLGAAGSRHVGQHRGPAGCCWHAGGRVQSAGEEPASREVDRSERTGIEVPESDYSDLATVDACVSYLEARVDGGEAAG